MSYKETKTKIDALKAQIEKHGPLTDEQKKKINYKFRLEWNFNSNSMEGNTLTVAETRSVMTGNLTVNEKPLKDVLEMRGHDEVITDILTIGKGDARLSEFRIKRIHKAIMFEDDEVKKAKIGEWKEEQNMIYNHKGEKYYFATPEETKDKMHDLLNRTNAGIDAIAAGKKEAPHPIDIALEFHLEYLDIHPFYDGNGRTARILSNLLLIAQGYAPFWITEKERSVYYNYISDIQSYGGSTELFYDYVAKLILRSQQLVLDAIEGKDITGDDDLRKEIMLLRRQFAGKELTKSPQNIATIFDYVRDDVWPAIEKVTSQFDEFFSESRTNHFVNHQEEVIHFQSVMNIFERTKKPEEIKIFGHGIYSNDIYLVEWRHYKYGLKGSNKTKYEINFKLEFETSTYSISASLNFKDVFAAEYKYSLFPDASVIKAMASDLASELLNEIKNDIN
ncbi:MAG: hypothetical protein CFE23_11870 [Flavobacterium sp. BFFFF1]|uniref:Fic family protein n=1 Tax=Flavobacterium sp. BFFFF1 TaxID=2015557 RepID=UPI000BDC699A|nr:Fic family protein [Flavobacterium sp. BFFFF1]OYU79945.1 MAG: hypothetical protein CFE23_11870 [Flavobacterium sp. BFFFF1]